VGRRAGVLGRPIAHSLSPVLHRAAYAALGLDWTYDAIDCGVDDLPDALAARSDWAGFSVTMPLKHALLEVAAEINPIAAAVGAGNTLLPGPRGWIADNTDVAGIVAALGEHAVAPSSVTILGAGGTAQAVLGALLALGVDECAVLVRDPSRTAALHGTAERFGIGIAVAALEAGAAALGAGLIVSTLPSGAADALAARSWRQGQAVFDVVYAPWPTPLAAAAARAGATVVSGALMLLHQAAVQVALMTGTDAPVDAMRAAWAAAVPAGGV
jgi:shikimate dehydrogenase